MKKRIACILVALSLLLLTACGNGASTETTESETQTTASVKPQIEITVTKDEKFGAATASASESDLKEAGIEVGDSVDIAFAGGYSLTDVPYYNGYYVKNGMPVMVAYPGYDYVLITLNNEGIFDTAGLSEGESAVITLNTKGGCSVTQEALGQVYSFSREDYASDEAFCNFRALTGGSLRESFLFRGASPVDNSRGRAAYTDALLENAGIKFILDLADSREDVDGYMAEEDFSSDYAATLLAGGNVALLDMGSAYTSADYAKALVSGLRQMINSEGPVYIHCMEGKDRTGFVCMLLEALAGAGYDEMLADYMTTYANYYSITKDGTPEKYDAVADLYFNSFMSYLHNTDDVEELKSADYTQDAVSYLINGGMTEAEVNALIDFITE